MRSRNIKPGFFKNEELAELSLYARLLFIGLWCMADKNGNLEKRPLRIKAEIFPYDSLDIHGELTVLERSAFIRSYQVEGKQYINISNFKNHQSPHHTEKSSNIPDISIGCDLTVNPPLDLRGNPPDSLIPDSLIPDSLIPDSLIPDSSSTKSVVSNKSKRPAPKQTDEEWLLSLKDNPAYKHINFDIEIGKAQAWTLNKGRKCSRAFLLNWFNKIEAPVTGIGSQQRPKSFREQINQSAVEAFVAGDY